MVPGGCSSRGTGPGRRIERLGEDRKGKEKELHDSGVEV